jgi:hypothetical protein
MDSVAAFEAALSKGWADPEPPKDPAQVEAEAQASAEPEDAPADDLPKSITVKVDGKDVELTPEQIAEAYKSGLRQSDYSRKTAETAEERKAAQAEIQRTQQERHNYAANLHRLQAQTEAVLQEQQQTDWKALLEADPIEYLKQQHLAQSRQATLQQVYAEQNRLAQAQQAEQAQMRQKYVQEQHQALLDKLPAWKDAAKAQAEKVALRQYLINEGYEGESVDNITDARAVLMARKAMLYDQMQAKAKETVQAVTKLPPRMEKPGVIRPTDGRTADMSALRKSGKTEDAAAIFAKLL